MFMFDWSALMTPQKRTSWTACVHFRDLYHIDGSNSSKFQHFLSAVTLRIYLCGQDPNTKRITRSVGPIVFELPILSGHASGLNIEAVHRGK
jgi:hypothetical protein